jgi:hypothetical protein
MLKQFQITAAKPYKLSAGKGLYLLIETSGSKLWRFRYPSMAKRRCSHSGCSRA